MRKFAARASGVLLILSIPALAYAHALAVYASTPVTPPKGWLWVPVLFLAATIVWDWYALGKTIPMRRLIWREALFLGTFAVVFFCIGFGCANMHTGPPPGLGLPHKPFYGLSLIHGGTVFLFFNALGLVLFLKAKRLIFRSLRYGEPEAWHRMRRAGIMVYVLALVPYALTNAMTHGWAGGYVSRGCVSNMTAIGTALTEYAEQHNGRLPEAESTEDLAQVLEPHLTEWAMSWNRSIWVCPIEAAYHRNPKPYEWNKSLSGATLAELEERNSNEPVVRCTTPHDAGGESPELYSQDLLTNNREEIDRVISERMYSDIWKELLEQTPAEGGLGNNETVSEE